MKKINIAIDGYSSCGKGTIARFLASTLGYKFIDSGAMYRALTLFAIQNNLTQENISNLVAHLNEIEIDFKKNEHTLRNDVMLNGKNVELEIRTMPVAALVSHVAKLPEVRKFLVNLQQNIGKDKGVVMDGRDIGTVVFPEAELKIFMTASIEVRAARRFDELSSLGYKTSYEEVLQNLSQRDTIDSTRETDPLTLTVDYRIIDNTHLSREKQNEIALGWAYELLQ